MQRPIRQIPESNTTATDRIPRRLALAILAYPLLRTLSGCASTGETQGAMSVLERDPELSTFRRLVVESGYAPLLASAGTYSVFAPINQAFLELPAATLDKMAEVEILRSVIGTHILPGRMDDLGAAPTAVTALSGKVVNVSRAGAYITVEEALATKIPSAQRPAVYSIDRVLLQGLRK